MTNTAHVGFTALTALPLFSRTYSRSVIDLETGVKRKETPQEAIDRAVRGLDEFELLTKEEVNLIKEFAYKNMVFVSGRWLWVGGTDWVKQQKNFIGAYNCAALAIDNWEALDFNFQALLMGCGVGTVVELDKIAKLPSIKYSIKIVEVIPLGSNWKEGEAQESSSYFAYKLGGDTLGVNYVVGDSKEGWVDIATDLLRFSSLDQEIPNLNYKYVDLTLDLSNVRPKDIILKGFGGKSNPDLLETGLRAIIDILNGAVGRQLNSLEVVLISNWAGAIAVSGNIRRSAKIQLISFLDTLLATAKDNLWTQDEKGNWKIDPKKDVLRLSNHTLTYHHKPDLDTVVEAVRKQYYSGEGAIQFVPEAVARSSADLLDTEEKKKSFIALYCNDRSQAKDYLKFLASDAGIGMEERELEHRMDRYFLNPCHSGDTLISTDRGLVPIKDLAGEKFQALVDLRSIGLNGTRLTDAIAFSTGVQTTYEIQLYNGQKMRCTAEHKHFTKRGWVATKDLTIADKVYIQRGEGVFGKATITVDQAQMIGWWYGDGYNVLLKAKNTGRKEDCYAKGFVFNPQEYPTAYPVVERAIESVTGRTYAVKLYKGVYEFRTQNPQLEKFFADLGITSKNELPISFLAQSKEVLIAFLQGIFCADGSVSKIHRHVFLTNKSLIILEQLQQVLLNLGIPSTIKRGKKVGGKGVPYTLVDGTKKISKNNGSYTLNVFGEYLQKFRDLVGFPLVKAKQEKLEVMCNKLNVPYFEKTLNNRFFASKVKEVKEFGEESVYDLTVPLTHSFIANGCVTHNCGK